MLLIIISPTRLPIVLLLQDTFCPVLSITSDISVLEVSTV
jgi:hypothetical protein